MYEQFGDFSHEETKGLFTFYREQAQNEEQLRKLKKERKLAKKRQAQLKKKQEEEQNKILQQKQVKQIKQAQTKQEGQKKLQEKDRRNLHEPKTRREKYNHHQLGSSVVIVNSKQTDRKQEPPRGSEKSSLKKIQQLINPHNNNRYFLQNKQIPSSFGKVSLQKMVVKGEGQQKESSANKNIVKPSYFNQYSDSIQEKKYIPAFSYDKLPQLVRSKPANSQIILPKRYKSKKVELALKSNNSELIRQIREGLRVQSVLERVSYVNANQGISSDRTNEEQEYERRLNSQLDAKQRRLIEIIRNSSKNRSKYLS